MNKCAKLVFIGYLIGAIAAIVVTLLLFMANANAIEPSNERVEKIILATVNDPDSVKFDSGYITTDEQGNRVACGQIRVKNQYGGVIRASYVIDPANADMPIFIGPTPLAWIGRRLCKE